MASRKRVMTPERIEREQAKLDARIAEYLKAMDAADAEESSPVSAPAEMGRALEALRARREELQSLAEQMQAEHLTIVADTGYANGEQAGITAIVPRPQEVNPKGDYFTRSQFDYDPHTDTYRCPAGQSG